MTDASDPNKDSNARDIFLQNERVSTMAHPAVQVHTSSIIEEENAILRQQHLILKSLLEKENEKNGRQKQRMEKLASILDDREKRITELQHYEYGLKITSEKKQDLESTLEAQRELFLKYQTENKILTLSIEESQQHAKQLQRVIYFLREKSEEARLEVNQFKEDLEEAHQTIATLSQQHQIAKEEAANLNLHLEEKQNSLQDAQDEITALQHQFEHLKNMVATTRQQLNISEQSLSAASQQAEQQRNENHLLRDRLNEALNQYHEAKERNDHLKATCDEHEQNVKMAQQHLGKKIKEAALQAEKNEEQQLLILELQAALADSNVKIETIKHDFESQLLQERNLREQLQNNLKATEAQVSESENKYVQLHSKHQDLERQNTQLKSFEEKQIQLQGLLNNVGLIMGGSVIPNSMQQTVSSSHPVKLTFGAAIENVSPAPFSGAVPESREEQNTKPLLHITEDTHNLFDVPESFVRYKQTLFD